MKKIISLILIIASLLSLSACGGEEDNVRSRTISNLHFNTVSKIFTYGDESDDNINRYATIADETLSHYHKLFDIYYEYAELNNIKTINKNAGKAPVKVDGELIDFLIYCKELYTLTDGKTNVMLGSVLKLWHNAREEADKDFGYLSPEKLPSSSALIEASKHVSIDDLIINEEESTVYISDAKASLDVGAIAKGYAVDILAERLINAGADSVVLNIGGNIRTLGLKPDGSSWVTGITNPDKESEESLICRIAIGDGSIVTSGDYERYFISGDEKYHHIIDPVTLMPANYFSSVTIVMKNSGLADALSTALFSMSYEDGLALAKEVGAEVIWIKSDGTIITTDGIKIVKN